MSALHLKHLKTLIALALSGACAMPALAQSSYSVACDITENTRIVATGMRPGNQSKSVSQTYRIDPVAKTVTQSMSVDRSTGQYVPMTTVFSDVRAMSSDVVLFCADTRNNCQEAVNTSVRGTSKVKYAPVTLNLADMTVSYDSQTIVNAAAGILTMNTQAQGTCRRL